MRQQTSERSRQQRLLVIVGAATSIALIALVIALNVLSSLPVGNEQKLPSQGNSHIDDGKIAPIRYNSMPPTSGPHYGGLGAWRMYSEPQRYETMLHNMEYHFL